ncbi:MAG: hypothetical protein HFF84_01395 [Oscillibacter sp.]|nr:hypothetical protein [Oscillibacter sp.]
MEEQSEEKSKDLSEKRDNFQLGKMEKNTHYLIDKKNRFLYSKCNTAIGGMYGKEEQRGANCSD